MFINKPLSHEIKTNDINSIELDEKKNININKNKNTKMNNSNQISEEIEEDEIIENYPYEEYEEEITKDTKNEEEKKIKKKEVYIIDDPEPIPEPDQIIDINYIKKLGSENNEDVIDFDEDYINVSSINENKNNENNLKESEPLNKDDNNNQLENMIKDKIKENKTNTQIIRNNEFIQNQNDKETSSKDNIINYCFDQEEILDILNLNKEKNNLDFDLNSKNNENIKNIILNQVNTNILLKEIYEKEMKFKTAYAEYYSKLAETMNNNYFQKMVENPINNVQNNNEKKVINKDFLIHQQTNTINDINIICLNNNNNNNNYLNFNEQNRKLYEANNHQIITDNNINNNNNNNKDIFNSNNSNQTINVAYEEYKKSKIKKNPESDKNNIHNEYIRHPTIILSIRKFLNEYNISIQNRACDEFSKNPLLNYELYIDILNDLYYIDQNILPQIYFINTSIYRQLWNFLIGLKNNGQLINNEDVCLESNILLMFLLILNGFFNNTKIINELEIELKWLNFEKYEILIMNSEYIEKNFGELIEIRKNNILLKSNFSNNLFIINNIQKKYDSEKKSKAPEELLSDYFNAHNKNLNLNLNNNLIENNNNNVNEEHYNNYSANKFTENKNHKKIINNINKQLYAFKPRNNSNAKKKDINIDKINIMKKNKSSNSFHIKKIIDTKLSNDDTINKALKKSKLRNQILNKINYHELYELSKNKDEISDVHINNFMNNNSINSQKIAIKNYSSNISTKRKSGNYSNIIKQNRTDLKKLFKNNEYKDGTINERYEQIKRQRNGNSKPKGQKVQINYEEYINLDKFKDKTDQNQKPKYQFRKHIPQKKNNVFYNFKIEDKAYVLEHNLDENIEIEIMQLIQKNNITGISVKSILEKIKNIQKNNSNEI